jgi:putative methionine-R-sulfoxide reductase with GAF domain
MDPTIEPLRALATATGDRAVRAGEAAEYIRAARAYHWVGLYDVTPSHITALAWTGTIAPAFPTFPRSQGINGAAVAAATPVIVQDVRQDPRYLTTFGATRAEAIFPVLGPGRGVVGTIDVASDRVDAFSVDDERFLEQCAVALAPLWG